MKKNLTVIMSLGLLALGAGAASAGGSKGTIGVGGEASIGTIDLGPGNGSVQLGGLSLNYDLGEFHVGGFLGFADGGGTDDTFVAIGGRFYYHIHTTPMSDFGIGGSVGVGFIGDGDSNSDNPTVMLLEPGLQIRAFVAGNVALSFTGGLSLGLVDAEGVAVTAQPVGSAGFHYYFF